VAKESTNDHRCTDAPCKSGTLNRYTSNPATKFRVSLCKAEIPISTDSDKTSEACYINADFMINLGKATDRDCVVIATQLPLYSTVGDFKKLIKQYKVKRVIMLTKLDIAIGKPEKLNNYFDPDPESKTKNQSIFTEMDRLNKLLEDQKTLLQENIDNGYFSPANGSLFKNELIVEEEHDNRKIYKIGKIQKEWFI
jgi:protein tyrosine phosphatase